MMWREQRQVRLRPSMFAVLQGLFVTSCLLNWMSQRIYTSRIQSGELQPRRLGAQNDSRQLMYPFAVRRTKKQATNAAPRIRYPDDGIPKGILSNVSMERLRLLQREVDEQNHAERCQRYGFVYNRTAPKHRRIFYGGIIADEPWEIFEIVAAEAYGILEGMVLVESNRTQNFLPRRFRRLEHDGILRQLFGTSQLQVRSYVNEDDNVTKLSREHLQRNEIVKGWKEMGMTPDDIGYVADLDETFSRDFLRAVQVCDGIDAFDYNLHHCGHGKAKLVSSSRTFEVSPECIIQTKRWYHPDMVLGACIEKIGNETLNPIAARDDVYRTEGFGKNCGDWVNQTDNRYPLWSPSDLRTTCGGTQVLLKDLTKHDKYTGYHFHNFFSDFKATRFKYFSYGHPDPIALYKTLEELSTAMRFSVRCVKNKTEDPNSRFMRVPGGFEAIRPNLPLYFLDKEYRQQRHAFIQRQVESDEKATAAIRRKFFAPSLSKLPPDSLEIAEIIANLTRKMVAP